VPRKYSRNLRQIKYEGSVGSKTLTDIDKDKIGEEFGEFAHSGIFLMTFTIN
jgi:hypothetical protein